MTNIRPARPVLNSPADAANDVYDRLPGGELSLAAGHEEQDNGIRARFALGMLLGRSSDLERTDGYESVADVVTYALANILHLCDATGLDYAQLESRARGHYLEEITTEENR